MAALRVTYNSSLGDSEPPEPESERIQLRPLISNSPSSNDTDTRPGDRDSQCLFTDPWWWCLEIGATCLSIVSATLLIILLHIADGTPMESWGLILQPNTIISILATAIKSSIMLVAAACMSQLKWRHFASLPRPLRHLQLYDDATRGPWGSMKLLCQLRTRAIIAYLLAIVTLAGLAIEPSAQQILDFPSRVSAQNNISATIGEAAAFDVESDSIHPDLSAETSGMRVAQEWLKAASHALGAIGDRVSVPYFDCPTPATECFWPELSTLGVCSTYSVAQASILMECKWDQPGDEFFYYCDFNLTASSFENGIGPLSVEWTIQRMNDSARGNLSGLVTNPWPRVTTYVWGQLDEDRRPELLGSEFMNMVAVRLPDTLRWTESNFTEADVSTMTWYWCEHIFENVTTNGSELHSELLFSGPLNSSDSAGADDYTFHSDASGRQYRVSQNALQAIGWTLTAIFKGPVLDGIPYVMDFLFDFDMEAVAERITAEINSQMRGHANINMTLVEGVAFTSQVYTHVRWIWIVLPLVEVLLSALGLLFTCGFNKRQPLLKSSSLALLSGRMELGHEASNHGRTEEARKLEQVRSHLHVGPDGRLDFVEEK